MDNEICKLTNLHWFRKICATLYVLYQDGVDSKLNLVHEEMCFPMATSECQKQRLKELEVMVMTLFYKRLSEIINKEHIKNALIISDPDLYKESIYMLNQKILKRSEYLAWVRDIVTTLKKLTQQNNLLYIDTHVFCQLAL